MGPVDSYHPVVMVHLVAPEWHFLQWGAAEVDSIKARIKEEYERWRLVRLFRSDAFGFPEPLPL
jgi:hypothetical protein